MIIKPAAIRPIKDQTNQSPRIVNYLWAEAGSVKQDRS